jgi:ATP-binding cassette, subfamily B, bacterial
VVAAVVGGLPLAIGLSLLYQRVWDARSLRLPLVLEAEGLMDAATTARSGKDFRSFELSGWVGSRWQVTQRRLLSEVASVRRRTTVAVVVWSVAGTGVLIATLAVTIPPDASPSDLVIVIGLLLQVTTALAVLVQSAADLSQLRRPLRAYLDFVLLPDEERVDTAMESWIGLDSVTFTYPSASVPALDRVSCTFVQGALNVVVGPNGAGKSTLLRVLDEQSITEQGTVSFGVRSDRAVMHQDFARFPFSVRDSVEAGVPHTDAAVEQVLDAVGLTAVVAALPRGLDTPLYRDGTDAVGELSGGQWQRLAIARLLLRARTSSLVVLDEPTAALDALGEAEVLDRVMQELEGRTIVLVTHRLQWAKRAAQVIEVTGPGAVRAGTHDELLLEGGWYAEAFAKQAEPFLE